MTSRGIRNNNPGNIDRHAGTKWQGMADDQSSDPRFVVFKSPQYGIRAIARLMLTYQNQYHLNTIRGLINRWAPPNENKTEAYIQAVAKSVGVGPDDEIDVDSAQVMTGLIKAIILHENGSQPYSDAVIAEGIRMAGVADAKPPPLAQKTSFQAQVGAASLGVAAAGAKAAEYAPVVKGWADQLGDFSGSPIISHVSTVLLTIAGGLVMVGIASQILKQRAA
jgi:hypothetical protein